MPGPAVHTIISEHLPNEFGSRNRPQLQSILDRNRTELTYGAMGPDPFFFNLNDLTPKWMSIAKAMVKTWDFLGHLKYKLNEVFQPLQNLMADVNTAIGDGVDFLSKNSPLVRRVRNFLLRLRAIGKVASGIMRGFVKKTLLDKLDPFGFYISPYQMCESDHEQWWWFDTLHSRQTGTFVANLLDIALGRREGPDGQRRQRDRLLAYAIGYLSHLAADVVGHAYVNTMVGGPYRLNQAQRHTTQEKIMDVAAYDHYYSSGLLSRLNNRNDRFYQNPNLINSGLHKNQQFTNGKYQPDDYQIDHNKLFQRPRRMNPVASGLELPSTITEGFSLAANRTYDTNEFGPLEPEEVDISYRLWYLVLRNSTSTRNVVRPKNLPPIRVISKRTKQVWNKFKNWFKRQFGSNPGGGGASGGNNCWQGGNFGQKVWNCVSSGAKSAWNFITNLAEATAEFFKLAFGLAWYAVQDLLSIPLTGLNFLLQKAYEALYSAYRTLLLQLTALGFGYCYNDQLNNGVIEHLWKPTATDHFGNSIANTIVKTGQPDRSGYPREGMQMGANWHDAAQNVMQGISQEGHLVIPTTPVETPETIPGPDVYATETPEVFISDPDDLLSLDPEFIAYPSQRQWDVREPSRFPRPKRHDYHPSSASDEGRFSDPVLGNAVQLTGELFERHLNPDFATVPNLNMSGDRGIGYPNWYDANGCGSVSRYRWWPKNTSFPPFPGKNIPWVESPIDARFHPDTSSHY